ncbi:hypothetical protein VNO78_06313 [Psophocarpus tetragonolobus]|uniref:Apple domain-containing protein n=1 Tax=Psophocarpus tetragonolobus TaxID=3891 RepID=A0AAN9T1T9_PSOTE
MFFNLVKNELKSLGFGGPDFYSGLYPQLNPYHQLVKYFRTGPWNGLQFSGLSNQNPNSVYEFQYVTTNDLMYASNKVEMFYSFSIKNSSVILRVKINGTLSTMFIQVWLEDRGVWAVYQTTRRDFCDQYAACGVYGNCMITESPVCQYLEGFTPKPPQQWKESNWSQGCVQPKPLSCSHNKDQFVKYVGMKVPDTTRTWLDENIDLEEFRAKCLNNCSCMAYANSDVRYLGSGCVHWFGDLIDIRQFETDGQDLYVRMPALDLEEQEGNLPKEEERGTSRSSKIIISTTSAALSSILSGMDTLEREKCAHVSLFCVQQYPDDRPTMSSVIQMLGSDEIDSVEPKEPGFFPRKISDEGNLNTNLNQMTSNNELTITLNGR